MQLYGPVGKGSRRVAFSILSSDRIDCNETASTVALYGFDLSVSSHRIELIATRHDLFNVASHAIAFSILSSDRIDCNKDGEVWRVSLLVPFSILSSDRIDCNSAHYSRSTPLPLTLSVSSHRIELIATDSNFDFCPPQGDFQYPLIGSN